MGSSFHVGMHELASQLVFYRAGTFPGTCRRFLRGADPVRHAVPAPGSLPLPALGLGAMLALRRRAAPTPA
jgi:hypothetical protein